MLNVYLYKKALMARGKSDREVVLNAIDDARKNLKHIQVTLTDLELLVRSKPDDGKLVLDDRHPRLFDPTKLFPVLGWVLTLCKCIFVIHWAVSRGGLERKQFVEDLTDFIRKSHDGLTVSS
jgi:hypothetical protein